jgi:hypothetical protein
MKPSVMYYLVVMAFCLLIPKHIDLSLRVVLALSFLAKADIMQQICRFGHGNYG